jgi:hypothetical protein
VLMTVFFGENMEFSLAKTHRFQAYLLHSPQAEVDVDATVLNPQFVGQDRPGPGNLGTWEPGNGHESQGAPVGSNPLVGRDVFPFLIG